MEGFNIVPLLNYRFRYAGIALFVLLALGFAADRLFGLSFLNKDQFLILFNLALIMINFSLEKNPGKNQLFRLYHTFKFAFVFLNTFLLSVFIVGQLFGKNVDLNILSIMFFINILFSIHYFGMGLLSIDGVLEGESGVVNNFRHSKKLYGFLILFSFLTLIVIVFLGMHI